MKTKIRLLTAGLMLCLLQLLTMSAIYAEPPGFEYVYDASKIIQPGPDADTGGEFAGRHDSIIRWSYTSEDKVLQIWGQGLTLFYLDYGMNGPAGSLSNFSLLPWQVVRPYVRVAIVHEGITGLGSWAFKDFINLEKVVLPNSLKYNYGEMVYGCFKLKELHFGSDTDFIPAELFQDNGVEKLFLKKIPRACCLLGLINWDTPYDNTSYPFKNINDTKRVTTIVPLNLLEEARASVVLQHSSNTVISEYEYYAGGGAYDAEYIQLYDTTHVEYVVTDTTHVEYIVTDTTHVEYVATDTVRIEVADTVRVRHVVEYTDTVFHTKYKTEYNIIFVPLEIKTDIYPFPEETKTPFLYRLTPTTFQISSPYDRETLYFYNISGELADKVIYYGGGTVQTSRPFYHTIIAVSDKGWYQIIYND